MLTSEDKREISKMIREAKTESIREEVMRLIPELFGRSLVQLKRFFIREIT